MSDQEKPKGKTEPAELRSRIEGELTKVWKEVLGIERVSVHDNFFQLAGDSISAIRLLSRVRDITQVELSLLDFIHKPTVAGMALAIMQRREEKSEDLEP